MAIKEQDKVFYEELANGDKVINLPITRANNVEGIGRSANTAYVVGDVVYVDNNKKVALKCTQAGTTSNTELDVSGKAVGDTITDGSVVWQVCNRTSDVTSVNGKTGDVVVDVPVTSVNGKTGDVIISGGSTVSITTGTIAHQGTIPLPSGYSRAQCKYAVWCHNMPDADGSWSTAERGNSWHRVQVDQSTGVVYCVYQYSTKHSMSGTAGYLCIAVK